MALLLAKFLITLGGEVIKHNILHLQLKSAICAFNVSAYHVYIYLNYTILYCKYICIQ